jgi:transposase
VTYKISEVAKKFNVDTHTLKNWIRKYDFEVNYVDAGQFKYMKLTDKTIEQIKEMLRKRYNIDD